MNLKEKLIKRIKKILGIVSPSEVAQQNVNRYLPVIFSMLYKINLTIFDSEKE